MCPHKVSSIKFEGSSWKIDFRNAKMPKSHDQPLCAYLMRYDGHIQSHPRSSPKWCIYQKNLNPVKRIRYHLDTDGGQMDGWTDGRTNRQGESSIPPPPPPQLLCGRYNDIWSPPPPPPRHPLVSKSWESLPVHFPISVLSLSHIHKV